MRIDWFECTEDFVDSAMEFIDSDEEVVRFFEDMRYDLDKLCEKKRKELKENIFRNELISFLKKYCGQSSGITEHNYKVMAKIILRYIDHVKEDAEAINSLFPEEQRIRMVDGVEENRRVIIRGYYPGVIQ